MLLLGGVTGAATVGGIATGGLLIGVGGASMALSLANIAVQLWVRRARIRIRGSDGTVMTMNPTDVWAATRIECADDEVGFRLQTATGKWAGNQRQWLEGEDARRALATILPSFNAMGGRTKAVRSAVAEIESRAGPHRFLRDVAGQRSYIRNGLSGYVNKMPKPTRLALEMAVHEEDERRALEGELWRLERAWRDAEEIAAISDDLLLPKGIDDFVARQRGREEEKQS